MLPSISMGGWSDSPAVQSALEVSPLYFIGMVLAFAMHWSFRNTCWGLILRMAGDSADAARALGRSVNLIRLVATSAGGFLSAGSFLSGVGGAFHSLYYPGNWNEEL